LTTFRLLEAPVVSSDLRICKPGSARNAFPEAWTVTVNDYPTAVVPSREGELLAVGTATGRLLVLEAESGALRFKTLAHDNGVSSIGWSPSGQVLATGGQDDRARLFDAEGYELAELAGDGGSVERVTWAPDGRHLATASRGIARVWTCSGDPVWKTDPHESTVTGLSWNSRGTHFATASSGGLHLFCVSPRPQMRRFPRRGSLLSLAWSPTDAIVACGTLEHSVHFWRVATGQDSEISRFRSKPRGLAWDAGGRLLATSGDLAVNVWPFDLGGPEGQPPIQLLGHEALCTTVAFHPHATTLASGGDDMNVLVWSPRKATTPIAVGPLEDTVTTVVWTPDARFLVGADAAGTVRAWRVT
jgi:WD40 repeat protein